MKKNNNFNLIRLIAALLAIIFAVMAAAAIKLHVSTTVLIATGVIALIVALGTIEIPFD